MSAPISEPVEQEPQEPQTTQEPPATPEAPAPVEPAEPPKTDLTPEQLRDELAKVRKEAANYRTKLRDQEPLVQAAKDAEEAQKTEIQRANDRAQALADENNRLLLEAIAAKHGVPEEDYDLLGSGTREELESRAQRLAARSAPVAPVETAPPSNRPIETLRPGASPTPPTAEDNSYPADWLPRRRDT